MDIVGINAFADFATDLTGIVLWGHMLTFNMFIHICFVGAFIITISALPSLSILHHLRFHLIHDTDI